MPEPIVAPKPVAPKTSVDYQNDAVAAIQAAMKNDPGPGEQPVAPAPAPKVSPDGRRYDAETGLKIEPKPPEAPKPPAASAAPDFTKSLEEIAKKSADARAAAKETDEKRASLKAELDELQAYRQARISGNPMAVLKLAGFSWQQVAEAAANGKLDPELLSPPQTAQPAKEPTALEKTVAELKAQLEQERAEKAYGRALSSTRDIVKANEQSLSLVDESELPRIVDLLNRYNMETGQMPGKDWNESVLICARARQQQLEKEAARFEKFLQSKKGAVKNGDSESAVSEAQSDAAESFTLTNKSAPRSPDTESEKGFTTEDYQKRATELLKQSGWRNAE